MVSKNDQSASNTVEQKTTRDNASDIRKRTKSKKSKKNVVLAIVCVIFGGFAVLLATAAIAAAIWLQDLPDVSHLDEYSRSGITTIYASDRETVLATITSEKRIEVESDEISQDAKDAVVAVEDERFYEHGAIDVVALARAALSTATGQTQGASTLTQQLARNTVLKDEMTDQTIARKVREAYVAMKLEDTYSKDEILTAYLNVVNFANSNYGIEAAARDYFNTSAEELDLAQAAFLVGIPNSPTQYNPRTNYDAALMRQHHVLDRMLANNMITQEQYNEAINEEIILSEDGSAGEDENVTDIAPYFVDYVKSLLESDMKYNLKGSSLGGCSIYTTLDVEDQQAAVSAIESVMDKSELDASLTAVDPENGYILAMVGGRNYEENNFNLSTQMNRQAGSTFKPFTLIAAMNQGISPLTKYDSTSPAKITDTWTVNNAEGHGSGMMTLANATTHSVNTVYARLAHEIGAQTIIDTAHAMGIKSNLTADETITLGTSGVNTLEMASAYATIAAGGVYHEPVAITQICDVSGNDIYKLDEDMLAGDQVLSPEIAAAATEVMSTVITSGTGRGAQLANGQPAAGKTGTSEHGRDLWFCGFTPQISCAVWTGYREETETSLYGGTTSTPIWKKFMDAGLKGEKVVKFETPDTIDELIYISEYSGVDEAELEAAKKNATQNDAENAENMNANSNASSTSSNSKNSNASSTTSSKSPTTSSYTDAASPSGNDKDNSTTSTSSAKSSASSSSEN